MFTDKRYSIGLLLLLIVFTASVISFYLLVFTWAIYIAGMILILLSSQKLIKKVTTVLLPIILYIPAMFIFLYLYNYTSPKIFLIPKNYAGTLRIIYDEKCGEKYELENGQKLIKFPKDGILILNEEFDGGTNPNDEYYSYDENGTRNKNSTITLAGSGVMSIDNLFSNEKPEDFIFVEYYVKSDIEEDVEMQKKYDSITMSKVKLCRRN